MQAKAKFLRPMAYLNADGLSKGTINNNVANTHVEHKLLNVKPLLAIRYLRFYEVVIS
jgi:hypothetical protein